MNVMVERSSRLPTLSVPTHRAQRTPTRQQHRHHCLLAAGNRVCRGRVALPAAVCAAAGASLHQHRSVYQDPHAQWRAGGRPGNSIQGSLILVGLASLFGIPLGLFTGIYLSEFGRGAIATGVRFLVDVLTGIPTIIFGLFAWIFIVVPQQGFSGLAGGVALGLS